MGGHELRIDGSRGIGGGRAICGALRSSCRLFAVIEIPSIVLKDVCVDLPIYNSRGRSLKSVLAQTVGGSVADDRDRSVVVIRALDHVSLHLEHGARVA